MAVPARSADGGKAHRPIQVSQQDDGWLVKVGAKKQVFRYEQVFALGYAFYQSGNFRDSHDLFKALSSVRGRGPRGRIMLAKCKAELESLEACEELLHSVFEGEQEPIADELQAAFVFHTMELREEAIREFAKIVNSHPDLPTACLFLGDLFEHAGSLKKAKDCWKLAVKRDRKGGGVATTARRQLKRVERKERKHSQAAKSRNDSSA